MRVLICGSRGWKDPTPIDTILAGCDVLSEGADEKLVVIQGGARGADTLAATLARGWRAQVITEEADWDRYGKGAGPVRNKKMLDDHKPDVVYAFRTYGKSNGTDDMCNQARARGIPVYVINGGDDAPTE
jgi:hypothetical protein